VIRHFGIAMIGALEVDELRGIGEPGTIQVDVAIQ